ncbi:polyphosphate polymerase domain-containing protein [Lysinibacillus odysseyi]|uniref:Molecular chaperone n=1 Tax=Lysinibacillus odysseyi 34hs-1 = NBRC 100172 TaxID=1220589 RepID=A0A0A3IRR6_9BACI|nr:polyphosphate polymerase domain-containing protein [Lysinibacillus odysseyi]KGR86150.1 molecular chaperone [Lysinibacillus odysseyi 34hs-1 = NBRC 100172]
MPIHTSFNPNGRKEMKFGITYMDYMLLRNKLCHIMTLDPYSGPDGRYLIRSCYFDNFDNKVMNEKKEGFLNRDKYRVRLYGKSSAVIHLERKSKRNNLTFKTKCKLMVREFERMQKGDIDWMEDDERGLVHDLFHEMKYKGLKPMTVVDYEREAYIYLYGNVRITFDSKVKSSLRNTDLFNTSLPMVDVLEPNEVILEVKYDEYLPDTIKMMLQGINVRQEAYSKYQLSRMYG